MKSGVYKNRYFKGTRPGLGVRTRDDQDANGFTSMDRDRKPHTREHCWLGGWLRGNDVDESLYRESSLARTPIDIFYTDNTRGNCAFADHDDYRADWGTGR